MTEQELDRFRQHLISEPHCMKPSSANSKSIEYLVEWHSNDHQLREIARDHGENDIFKN